MRTSFNDFLVTESIEDKGIFKAIFMAGTPGAGKSYVVSKLEGDISPRVVTTDKPLEFLQGKKFHSDDDLWRQIGAKVRTLTKKQLTNYVNGVLPLIIDGTSSSISHVQSRAGLLESIGYDVGMVFVNTRVEDALKRAAGRDRTVSPEFIRQAYDWANDNKEYYQERFPFFTEVNNSEDALTDETLQKVFKKVQGFYKEPIKNPVGRRRYEEMREAGAKYLVPKLFSQDKLDHIVDGWFRS